MRIGFNLPHFGEHAHHPEGVAVFAREAVKMGADSLWVGDRLLALVHPEVHYPGSTAFPREFRPGSIHSRHWQWPSSSTPWSWPAASSI